MSFKRQRNKSSCGPASLRYACTFLGITADEDEIGRAAGITRYGVDENGIARAAKRYGCAAVMRMFRSFPVAFRHLMRYVQSGQPCILCVDSWKHWVTVAGASGSSVALFDPGSKGVAALIDKKRLRRRWRHCVGSEEDAYYFFVAVRPRNGSRRSPRMAGGLSKSTLHELRKRDELRQGWNQYLQDLSDIFDGSARTSAESVPAWRFIRRNTELLVELVSFWDGALPKNFYRKELRNLEAVARAHGFQVKPANEKSVLISLSCILSHQTPAV